MKSGLDPETHFHKRYDDLVTKKVQLSMIVKGRKLPQLNVIWHVFNLKSFYESFSEQVKKRFSVVYYDPEKY